MESACAFVIVTFCWPVSSGLPLLWGGGEWDADTPPHGGPDHRDETIKDKRIKEMKRWKGVIAASPAESLIRSDRILGNAQCYEKMVCVFPIQLFSLHLAPLTLCVLALLVTNAFPWASHRPRHSIRGTLVATGVFCDVGRHTLCCHCLSVTPLLSPHSRHSRLSRPRSHSMWATSLIVLSQHLWLQSIWNLNSRSDKVAR